MIEKGERRGFVTFLLVSAVLLGISLRTLLLQLRILLLDIFNSKSIFLSCFRYAKYRWSAVYVTYYCTWFRLFATAVIHLSLM